MGGGGDDSNHPILTRSVLVSARESHNSNNNDNAVVQQHNSRRQLRLCMLACENKPPYGPAVHTAALLLDLVCMGVERCYNNNNNNNKDVGSSSNQATTTESNSSSSSRMDTWEISIHVFNVQTEEYPNTTTTNEWDTYDGFLLPGSFSSAYDTDDWIETLKQQLQIHIVAPRRPTLAICFGHQIMAHSFYPAGQAVPVPTGPRVGRQSMPTTPAGAQLLLGASSSSSVDLFFTHGDMVERLPPSACNLGGNDAVPIQTAAYFDSPETAQLFLAQCQDDDLGNDNHDEPVIKPFCISFQAHPEYATTTEKGLKGTMEACMDAMEQSGRVDAGTRAAASQDAAERFVDVQNDSVQIMVQVGRWLGWFP